MRLLKRLLPSQDIDALLGDIVEESRRRSRLWYWSQIVGSRRRRLVARRAEASAAGRESRRDRTRDADGLLRDRRGNCACDVGVVERRLLCRRVLADAAAWAAAVTLRRARRPCRQLARVRSQRLGGRPLPPRARLAMAMPFLAIIMLLALIPLRIVVTDTGPGIPTMSIVRMIWTFGTLFLSIPGGILLGGYAATRPAERA